MFRIRFDLAFLLRLHGCKSYAGVPQSADRPPCSTPCLTPGNGGVCTHYAAPFWAARFCLEVRRFQGFKAGPAVSASRSRAPLEDAESSIPGTRHRRDFAGRDR